MTAILLPSTDAGVLVQVVVVTAVWICLLVAVRRSAEASLLVGGLGVITLAWFALRTLH